MTLVIADPIFQQHNTGSHPETPKRLQDLTQYLQQQSLAKNLIKAPELDLYKMENLTAVHSPAQVKAVEDLAAAGGGYIDPDTVVSPASFHVALRAAASGLAAADAVVAGKTTNALCLVRPPGHHANQNQSQGFCLLNNIALTAEHCLKNLGMHRVAILDFDVHHGNGTQDIFYEREDVLFVSLHRWPFYPGSGSSSETGSNQGLGATLNFPIEASATPQDYMSYLDRALDKIAHYKPDILLLSAGFDAHKEDPIGSLGLSSQDFLQITNKILVAADTICKGALVSLLEGGYNIKALSESVANHLRQLEDFKYTSS